MGKGASGSAYGYDYYGSLIALVCAGPVDVLDALIVDGKTIVTGPISRGVGEDYAVLTVDEEAAQHVHPSGASKLVLFWGTDTQEIPDAFPEVWAGANPFIAHPDYRGFCVLAMRALLLGRERTSAPNLEIIVGRKPVVDTSLVAAIDNTLDDGQVNPVAALAELLTSGGGLGLSASSLQAADWVAAGAYCADAPARHFCSTALTTQSDARTVLPELLAMFDGALYWTAGGKLGLKCIAPGAEFSGDTIAAAHLTLKPRIEGYGWDDVPTTALIRYPDREKSFKQREAKADNILALRARGSTKTLTVEAKHVTRASQAAALAAELLRRAARPPGRVEISVRRAFASSVAPGDKLIVDVDPEPGGGRALVCVVQDRRDNGIDPVELTLVPDLLATASPYSPDITEPAAAAPFCDPLDQDDCLVIPLPPELWPATSVAVLAPRPSAAVVGFRAFFADDDESEEWADLGTWAGFATQMVLDEDLTDDETEIQLTLAAGDTGPDAYLPSRLPDNAVDAGQDKTLLVLANVDANGRVVITDGSPEMEICSVVTRSAVDTDTHVYTVLRARMGIPAREWAASATPRCYIIPAASVRAGSHPTLTALLGSGGPGFIRMVAYTAAAEDVSTPIPEVSFALPPSWWHAPSVTWTTPSGSLGLADGSGQYTPDIDVMDAGGDLVGVSITSRKTDGTGFVEHAAYTFAPAASWGFSALLTFTAGTHTLTVTATDAGGSISSSSRTIQSTGGTVPPVSLSPEESTGFFLSITVAITGASPADQIQWQVVSIGSPAPTSGWSETTIGDVTQDVVLTSSRRIWSRAKDSSGPTYSDWTFGDYYRDSGQ